MKRRLNSHRSKRKMSKNFDDYSTTRKQTNNYDKKTRKYGAVEVELEDEQNEYEEELNKDN